MQALYVSSYTSPPRISIVPNTSLLTFICFKTAPLYCLHSSKSKRIQITMKNISPLLMILRLVALCYCFTSLWAVEAEKDEVWGSKLVVKKDERSKILETEFGEISVVKIGDGDRINGSFHLQFFKLEPNALFLPVMLHSEMMLYCHSGSGDLTWIGHGKKSTTLSLARGDVYRLRQGSVFFIRSNLGTDQRERLRITALFANFNNEDLHPRVSWIGPYSSIADLVRGFDSSVLQAAFQVSEEVIQTIKSAAKQPLIIQDVSSQPEEGQSRGWEGRFMRVFLSSLEDAKMENKKKKQHKESRAFNVYTADRDFENCNGWSLTVTSEDLEVLKDSDFGAFYVNLTKGAMMAPHWNPMATEVAFVVAGQGMVRIVCSSSDGINKSSCENQSFKVEEGDVFMVPRFHPMSQTSFNNDSFVFMGFSTTAKRNYPQYLVGKQSVFQVIDKDVLAAAFNVDNETVVQLMGPQEEALIVECTSCAEEQFSALQEEVRKKWEEEEARKREEEERRKREEEEAARKREEEERRKREEEEAARKREEEEAARKREEEEAARKREEAREEEERRQREEQARREEEERKQREKEERAEQERRQREEEERAEQERRQREEEAERQEERRRREEEERGGGGGPGGGGGESEEEAARRQEKERERREQEEEQGGGHGGEEERQRRRHAARRERHQSQEEETGRRRQQGESEGEAAMRQEEQRIRREQEQMEHGRSAEPPVILVDNLDKVIDLLF